MALDAGEISRIYTQVANGTAKADYPFPLSAEASAFWDQVERDVAGARAQGLTLEMIEVDPDIAPWVADAPEAQPSS